MLSKTCTVCGLSKLLSEFYADSRNTDGRGAQWKGCRLRHMRNRYKDPGVQERKQQTNRKWVVNNEEVVKEVNRNNMSKYRKETHANA